MGKILQSLLKGIVDPKKSKSKPGGAPTALIYGGLAAVVFGLFMLRLILAQRKIAKLAHEANVLKEEKLRDQHKRSTAKLKSERQGYAASLKVKQAMLQQTNQELARKKKEGRALLAEVKKVTSWSDLIIKKK